ncbi:MAG TPA: hypothetical protein P5119_08165 [Candidatus Aminicenantes bacterium]|nr:hypothetical protein [Candidatus Aminicenantes bacterium]HRY65301.1 hypothetical protein [Candidatus Aminicenantes bacterium]HRZ72231.1 hypothetical protein [Candidatus Aminicenantes bacterium]
MGIKRKETVTRQKASFEEKLKARQAFLAGKGVSALRVDRDPIVKNLKAEIKAIARRLARIDEIAKRTEEMARIKAEKAAAPKKVKEEGGKATKPKAAAAEGKAKKPKAEGAKGEAKAPKKKPEGPKAEPVAPAKPEE